MTNTIFKNINDFHKSGKKSDFQKKLPSLETNLTLLFFFFFTGTTQNESRITKYPPVERR